MRVVKSQLEAVDVDYEQQQLGSLHVFQEPVSHPVVYMRSLDQSRQIGNFDLRQNGWN